MATTIQVDESTLAELRAAKDALGFSSYDALVRGLLVTLRKRRSALVAIAPGLGPFERERGDRD